MFALRGLPNLAGGIGIHDGDAEADNQVRPSRQCVGGGQAGTDNGEVGEHIISGREERCFGQAAGMVPMAREQKGTSQVYKQRARPGKC